MIGKTATARVTRTVGSTRKYGVKPLPKSKRWRRLGLLLGTSIACVAICTYPFMRLSTARGPASTSAPCNFIAGDLPMGTDTDTADFSTKVMLYRRVSVQIVASTPLLATHYIILFAHDVLQIQR